MNRRIATSFKHIYTLRKIFLLIVMLSQVMLSTAEAQNQGKTKIDSLISVLKTLKEDTAKVNTLNRLADEFKSNNPDTSIYFASQAQELAIKLNYKMGNANAYSTIGTALMILCNYEKALQKYNNALTIYEQLLSVVSGTEKTGDKSKILKQKAGVYNNIGIIYNKQANYSEALKNLFAALKFREETGDKRGIARSYGNIASTYLNQGNYPEAVKNYFASLKIFEEIGDQRFIANTYVNLGIIYDRQANYPEALKNYFASLKIQEEIGDRRGSASSYHNIGIAFQHQGNFPEALKNDFTALKLNEELGDKGEIANTLNNIGLIYNDLGNYTEALKNYTASLKIREEIGDKRGIVDSHINLGILYRIKKKNNEASQYLNKALSLAKEIGSLEDIKESYRGLAALDSAQGNFKKSITDYKMYIITRDSLLNRENTKKIEQSKMQYEFDKKRLADSLTNEKEKLQRAVSYRENLRKKNTQRNIFLFGGIAFLVLSVGLWRRLRDIRRSKATITKEKERSEELLLNILPYEVAEELKQTGHCQAKTFSMVTVMFTDFKDFTNVSEKFSAELLVEEINYCFSAFDQIVQKYKVEKIKTVGDAYICVSGLPVLNFTHALNVVRAALEIRDFMISRKKEKEAKGELTFESRIGIHTGPVVAGIVGVKKFQYDIWGDTVNLAARMESSGEAGMVNISGTTHALVKDKFNCTHRGKIVAKHKGEIDMYFVEAGNPQTAHQ